ncbi:hypothetical protein HPP92_022244 [Vanilla planifolia]|uniref:CRIB domain-containing protein n=1 Tax=Vanilla planifolia TaxID=51239 RepID=A0A835UD09_VANPL|nr:hypothetical protein HPP92_022244 [Vanilla planifolia]
MARFQVHLRFLSPSPLSKRSSVREAKVEVTGTECESGDDLVSSPLIPMVADRCGVDGEVRVESGTQFSLLATAAAALRRSLVLCSLGAGEEGNRASLDIGWPTEVQHIAHVTFDRFDGFLGLPVEFLPEISSKVPSARSLQCSEK